MHRAVMIYSLRPVEGSNKATKFYWKNSGLVIKQPSVGETFLQSTQIRSECRARGQGS